MKLIELKFERDLNEFVGISGTGLTWSGGAALASSSGGLSVNVSNTTPVYGYNSPLSATPDVLTARFHLDPNSMTIPSAASFIVFTVMKTTGYNMVAVNLEYDGSNYQVRAFIYDDAESFFATNWITINDADTVIEVSIVRATSVSANDGSVSITANGSTQSSTGRNIYTSMSNYDDLRVGAVQSIDSGTAGTFYIDEVVLYDDARTIGSAAPPIATTYYIDPVSGNDANAGTSPGTAWKTVAKFYTEAANGIFQGGDTVRLMAGTHDIATIGNHQFRCQNISGTSIKYPFTIMADDPANIPLLDAAQNVLSPIYGDPNDDPLDFVVLKNLEIYDVKERGGVSLQLPAMFGWRIENVYCRDFTRSATKESPGFYIISGRWMYLKDCKIRDTSEGFYIGGDVNASELSDFIIIENPQSPEGGKQEFADFKNHSAYCVIRGGQADGMNTLGSSTAAVTIDGDYILIRESTLEDAGLTDAVWDVPIRVNNGVGATIEFNLLKNLTGSTANSSNIRLEDEGATVRQNTIVNSTAAGIRSELPTGKTAEIKNNIIYSGDDRNYDYGYDWITSVIPTSDNNILAGSFNNAAINHNGTDRTLASYNTATGQDANSLTGVAFVEQTTYTIGTGSTAYQAGAAIGNSEHSGTAPSIGYYDPTYGGRSRHVRTDGFETGDTSRATSTSGTLSVTSGGSFAGNKKLEISVTNSEDRYYQFDAPYEDMLRCHTRLYFKHSSLAGDSANDEILLLEYLDASNNVAAELFLVSDGTGWDLQMVARTDTSVKLASYRVPVSADTWHYFEMAQSTSVGPGKNNGHLYLKFNGGYEDILWPLDNDTLKPRKVRFGAMSVPAGVTGTFYFDELIIDEVGTDIDDEATGLASAILVPVMGQGLVQSLTQQFLVR